MPEFGRAMIVEKNGHWSAIFECEREVEALPLTGKVVGIDRGVTALVALSDRGPQSNPKFGQRLRHKLERAHRRVARRKQRGGGRKQAVRLLARVHETLAECRRDYAHKWSRVLVDAYDVIVLEKLA